MSEKLTKSRAAEVIAEKLGQDPYGSPIGEYPRADGPIIKVEVEGQSFYLVVMDDQ